MANESETKAGLSSRLSTLLRLPLAALLGSMLVFSLAPIDASAAQSAKHQTQKKQNGQSKAKERHGDSAKKHTGKKSGHQAKQGKQQGKKVAAGHRSRYDGSRNRRSHSGSARVIVPRHDGPTMGHNISDVAQQLIGIPYRSGGSSPSTGFDCSGMVQWVYGRYGVHIPRSSTEQISCGKRVPRSELQPGDIVVFRSPRSPNGYHSGIYVGNNRFIHSPSAGKRIRVESMDSGYYAGRLAAGRRMISNKPINLEHLRDASLGETEMTADTRSILQNRHN